MTPHLLGELDLDRVPPAPNSLFELAHQQFLASPSSDRRSSRRFFIAAHAIALPLKPEGTPAGEAFRGLVADLSMGEMLLMLTRDFDVAAGNSIWTLGRLHLGSAARHSSRRRNSYFEYSGAFLTPLRLKGFAYALGVAAAEQPTAAS